jgi:hypothetical protein
MLKVTELEVPPPGAGLKTETVAVPVAAMSLAETCAMRVILPSSVVGRFFPFHRTAELGTKFVPITANVKACAPTGAQSGSRELIVGTGFVPLGMSKFTGFEVPPPGAGLVTVTAAVPAEAIAAAGMTVVNWVELTNVVVRAVPAKLTTDAETKFVPLTVSVKPDALPATALVGEIAVIAGTGLPPPPVEAVPPPHPASNSSIPAPSSRLAMKPPAEIEARRRFIVSSFFRTDNLVMPTLLGEDGANQCLAAGFWLVSF